MESFRELYPVPVARTDKKDPMAAAPPAATTTHPAEALAREVADSVRSLLSDGIVLTATLRDGAIAIEIFNGPRAQVAERIAPSLDVAAEWVLSGLLAPRPGALPLYVHLAADNLTFGPFDIRDPLRLNPGPKSKVRP